MGEGEEENIRKKKKASLYTGPIEELWLEIMWEKVASGGKGDGEGGHIPAGLLPGKRGGRKKVVLMPAVCSTMCRDRKKEVTQC